MIKKTIFSHFPHYVPLLGIFSLGVLGFIVFSYDKEFQIGIAISVACAHFCWGVVHHMVHKDFSTEVLIEYLAISILGLAAMLSLVLRF